MARTETRSQQYSHAEMQRMLRDADAVMRRAAKARAQAQAADNARREWAAVASIYCGHMLHAPDPNDDPESDAQLGRDLHRVMLKTYSRAHSFDEMPGIAPHDDIASCRVIAALELGHSLRYSVQLARAADKLSKGDVLVKGKIDPARQRRAREAAKAILAGHAPENGLRRRVRVVDGPVDRWYAALELRVAAAESMVALNEISAADAARYIEPLQRLLDSRNR